MRVKWLRMAISNLETETTFLAQVDPESAVKMYTHIRERVAALADFPELGRPGRIFETRELVIDRYPYLVPYRVKANTVEILRIFHTSRKQPNSW